MLNPDLISFLSELSENNNKEWFDSQRKRYQALRAHFINFVALLIHELSSLEPALTSVNPSKTVFRINRDIRFSQNKSPYKTNIGAYISSGGKNILLPGYYFHVEPGASMIAGGMYMPPSPELKKIRREVFDHADEFRTIIDAPGFKSTFGTLTGEQLKTAPQGYPKDHPDIELIRFKSYAVMHAVDDDFLTDPDLMQKTLAIYRELKPFNDFLRHALEGQS